LYLLAVERGSDKNEVAVAFWKEVLTVASRDEADPRRSKLDVLVVTAEESMVVVVSLYLLGGLLFQSYAGVCCRLFLVV
jgi:hypothetical protein